MTEEFWNSLEWLSDVLFCGCYEAFLYQSRNSVDLNNKPIFKRELFSDLLQYSLVLEEWHVYIFCENVLKVVENQIKVEFVQILATISPSISLFTFLCSVALHL